MTYYDIAQESKGFALHIIKVHDFLIGFQRYELAKQLVRAGTSVGVAESQRSQSKKDFLYKLDIALKEANETKYWLELLDEAGYLQGFQDYNEVYERSKEMIGVIIKIVKTTRNNMK